MLCALIAATPVWGQSLADKIEIHGFGGWAFADTDGNRYLLGDEDGNYDTAELSLNVTAKPAENLTIVAQIHFERNRGEEEVELDYGFAEWYFSDAARIRFGRVKHPYGLYGEIFDVGTLRPFYLRPQGIYGKSGVTGNNYNGIGLKGSRFFDRWGLEYDVYAGQIESEISVPGLFSSNPEDLLEPVVDSTSTVDDLVGARLNIQTPIEPLTFGISGTFGSQGLDEVLSALVEQGEDRESLGGHLQYSSNLLLIRAEYTKYGIGSGIDVTAYYLEAAYYLSKHWQVAARFDNFDIELADRFFPGGSPPFVEHTTESDDLAFALNYWFSRNFVLRLSYHRVEGNRSAFPEDPAKILAVLLDNVIETETDMILFGAQFSF